MGCSGKCSGVCSETLPCKACTKEDCSGCDREMTIEEQARYAGFRSIEEYLKSIARDA